MMPGVDSTRNVENDDGDKENKGDLLEGENKDQNGAAPCQKSMRFLVPRTAGTAEFGNKRDFAVHNADIPLFPLAGDLAAF